jgi:GxxExxY protein
MLQNENLTGKIIGCAMRVHRALGPGFQEAIYQKCLVIELEFEGITSVREVEMPIFYRDIQVGTRRVDILVEGIILVELKALTKLEDVHIAQAKNYLEAFKLDDGLLINFGGKSLEFKRMFGKKNRELKNSGLMVNSSA